MRNEGAREKLMKQAASMTEEKVSEMVAGTRQKRPRYLASLIHLPALALNAIAKMAGWQYTE